MQALINNEKSILGINIYTKLLLNAVKNVIRVQRVAVISNSHFLFKISVKYPITNPKKAFDIVKTVPVTNANY
jgi:hypothetical protein